MSQSGPASPESYLDWVTRGNCAIWRYIATIGVTYFLWIILPAIILVPFVAVVKTTQIREHFLEFSFLPGFVLLPLVVWFILGRPAWSVASPVWPLRWADYGAGILMGLAIGLIGSIAALPFVSISYRGFDGLAAAGTVSILVTLIGCIIQTGFEELLFRALIAQFTRRLVNFAPLIVGVQAVVFGYMHLGNVKAWGSDPWGVTPYVMVALVWGFAAWRTGSLLVPAALHFVNNASNSLLVGAEGDIVKSIAPLVVNSPSIGQAVTVTAINGVVTALAVEWYAHWRARNRTVDSRN
jgi:CAAX protease family protein